MRLIGEVIKEARLRKKLSKNKLEKDTKIKKDFIEAIEESRWDLLPEFPVVSGFVKTIATYLGLKEDQLVALLRRDYPPKDLKINPNPDISEKFTWSPKATFILGISVVILLIIGYLIFQYLNFIKPPNLQVSEPEENSIITQEKLFVRGKTDPDAAVLVNNQPTLVAEDGTFETEIEVFQGTTEIVIIAKSRSGKETLVQRLIKVNLADQ